MKLAMSLSALLLAATPAFADGADDHRPGGDPYQVAQAAFTAADDAEALQHDAGYGCAGYGQQVAQASGQLHYALSDLYHAAQRGGGHGVPEDHRDGEWGVYLERIEQAYGNAQNAWYYAQSRCNYQIQRTWQSLQWKMSSLYQTCGNE